MKLILTVWKTERECGPLERIDLTVETSIVCNLFQADVHLTLEGKTYVVEPRDLVVLGEAMESHLAQRREAERLAAQTPPFMQHTR
jgi:hypothetical protein